MRQSRRHAGATKTARPLVQRRGGQAFWGSLHYETEGDQAGDDYGEAGDYIWVGRGGRLLREKGRGAGVRAVRSVGWAHTLAAESGGEAVDHLPEARVAFVHVGGEIRLALLGAASDEGGEQRDANAAADIADETDHAGDLIIFFGRDVHVGKHVRGHEDKGEAGDLIDAEHGGGAEIHAERHVRGHVIKRGGGGSEADGH